MNFYSIRHLTRFRYSQPVSESIMETRMHPRTDATQHCLSFTLSVSPRCRVFTYRDHQGNNVQHFDIPGDHTQLVIIAESIVEQQPAADIPGFLSPDAWGALDELVQAGDYWEMLLPSTFAVETPALLELAGKLDVRRRDDPLMLVQELNQRLFDYFEYVPRHTRVDSPIDEAILSGKGVCQDFAHTMIALLRHVRHSGALRVGLSLSEPGRPRPLHARRHACLGRGASAASRLGRIRSHQQPGGPPSPHSHGHRPRLPGRSADPRDFPRARRESELYVAVHVEAGEQPPALDRKMPIPEDWSVLVERAQQPPDRAW